MPTDEDILFEKAQQKRAKSRLVSPRSQQFSHLHSNRQLPSHFLSKLPRSRRGPTAQKRLRQARIQHPATSSPSTCVRLRTAPERSAAACSHHISRVIFLFFSLFKKIISKTQSVLETLTDPDETLRRRGTYGGQKPHRCAPGPRLLLCWMKSGHQIVDARMHQEGGGGGRWFQTDTERVSTRALV